MEFHHNLGLHIIFVNITAMFHAGAWTGMSHDLAYFGVISMGNCPVCIVCLCVCM